MEQKRDIIAVNKAIAEMAETSDRYVRMIRSGKRPADSGKAKRVMRLVRLYKTNPGEFLTQYHSQCN